MKKVGFIGAYDKTNLIMCIAKVLTAIEKRVLIVDTTAEQKLKYVVPTIHPTRTYITTWEQIDVAVGFDTLEKILEYIGVDNIEEEYDIILMNIDSPMALKNMKVVENDINCFITAMDLYSIRKGLEIFGGYDSRIDLIKVIFSRQMSDEDGEYIDYIADGVGINWTKQQITFPLILDDKYVEMDSQLIYRLGLKNMSSMYKESLAILLGMLFEKDITEKSARNIIKALEKGGI